MRELEVTQYNSERFTDENVLYKNKLIDPVTLSNGLTYLYGKDSDMYPLLSLTDGQKGMKSVTPLADTQYKWKVLGRMKHTSTMIGLANGSNTKPGLGHTSFEVDFEDDMFLKFHTITSPDKQHTCRVQGNVTRLGAKKFRAKLIILGGNSAEYVTLGNLQPGQVWVMGAALVSQSKSDGTSSNSMAPGTWTSQFGLYRFSKNISGNVANKVVNFEVDLSDGSKTNMWMPFEMKTFEMDRRLMLEDKLWNAKYNRDSYGNLPNKDDENGEPLPESPGIKDILYTTDQYDTYGSLTLAKLDSIINRCFINRVDDTPPEIVLIGGKGAARQLNNAIKNDAINSGYYEALGKEEIQSGTDGMLSYGKYFNQYKTVDGYKFTYKPNRLADVGLYAEMDRANGRVFDGLPYESYDLFILDVSRTSDGDRNMELVAEKGREVMTGVYAGMTNLPASWGAINEKKLMSTRRDEASYEVMVSQGLALRNYTTSFWLHFQP